MDSNRGFPIGMPMIAKLEMTITASVQRGVFFINNTAAAPLARLTPSGTLKSSSLA
jgi:hypothetical protein